MKTVFTYAHVKWFYGQSERAYYLNYFIKKIQCECLVKLSLQIILKEREEKKKARETGGTSDTDKDNEVCEDKENGFVEIVVVVSPFL